MSTVTLMTSLLTEDCSRFLPPQHRTLDHRLFEDVSVAEQDPLMTQNGMPCAGSALFPLPLHVDQWTPIGAPPPVCTTAGESEASWDGQTDGRTSITTSQSTAATQQNNSISCRRSVSAFTQSLFVK